MKQKTITLTAAAKDGNTQQAEVTLAYCYATEIAYRDLSGEDITDFMQEASIAINGDTPRMPDVEKTICAIIAAIHAYYKSKEEESPVKDTDLMYHCTPQDLALALGTIIGLRAQFYALPAGEPEDKPDNGKVGRKRKNA